MLKEAGAKEVHVRIAAPPMKYECKYGAERDSLIAADKTKEEICAAIGADSLAFLSVEGLERAIVERNNFERGISMKCFTGKDTFQGEEEAHRVNHINEQVFM